MKLPSVLNILFSWRPIASKLKVISIFKNMKNTVIFVIFTEIKRHNFKYIGQFLIKFSQNNIGSLGFGMHSVLFENINPLAFYHPLNWENMFYLLPKKFVAR